MANDRRLLHVLFVAVLTASAPTQAQTASAPPAPAPPASAPPAPAPAPPAPAPPPVAGDAAARADALFQEGKRLLEQGKTEAACTALAQSDAVDPAVSTLGLLAACHEQQGRLATAWRDYRETARRAAAAGDSRGEFAQQRVAALEPRLPRLVIRLAKPVPGVQLTRNQEPVPASDVGVEVPVDPGTYEIVARAADRREHRVVVVAREGAAVAVDVPELAPLEPPPVTASPALVAAPPREAPPRGPNTRVVAGLIVGGAGLAGLGVGIGFGVSALNRNLESRTIYDTCKGAGAPADACGTGRALRGSAFSAATVSSVGLGVGLAGLGTGLALLLWPSRAPSAPARTGLRVTPLALPQGGGALMSSAF